MRTVFLRVLKAEDKGEALRQAVGTQPALAGVSRMEVDPANFKVIDQCPFVYSVPRELLRRAAERRTLAALGAKARQGFGASTRFQRLWWEIAPTATGVDHRWIRLAHGSAPVAFYKSTYHVILWDDHGREAKADVGYRYPYLEGNYGFKIQSEDFYGRPGLCYGKRTERFTAQVMPAEHAFSFEGTAIHVDEGRLDPWVLLGLLNCSTVAYWLDCTCAQHKTYNYVDGIPMPCVLDERLRLLAMAGWAAAFRIAAREEVADGFVMPLAIGAGNRALIEGAGAVVDRVGSQYESLRAVLCSIDELCAALYGLGEGERMATTAMGAFKGAAKEITRSKEAPSCELADDGQAGWAAVPAVDAVDLVADLVSWTVGVAFGRFDIRLATGHRQPPPEPDPFDPLPPCSPGMLTGDDGLPVLAPPAGYPIAFPPDGILVDDPGHPSDIAARARQVFDVVFGDDADARWQEAAELVDPRSRDVRQWLARDFFPRHLRMYSKSRRKAPIYWQLATPSASYSVWLYYHRFTRDTLFRVLSEYVSPKLRHEERRLTAMTQHAGQHPTPAQRREIAAQASFIEELRSLRDELGRVAQLWNPDLDDGVIINCAPLWRLSPHHKAWQREVKACWDKLSAGDYDWAHLAMHLWPERVVAKCAQDRSLAIAHGLEDALWVEDAGGKWRARDVDPSVIEHLVAERSSPSVKAALADLLAADGAQTATTGRGRRR